MSSSSSSSSSSIVIVYVVYVLIIGIIMIGVIIVIIIMIIIIIIRSSSSSSSIIIIINLSNAVSCVLRVPRCVKDHHNLIYVLRYSPPLKKACVRQVALDKWTPLSFVPFS